jgi:hypothetical protein
MRDERYSNLPRRSGYLYPANGFTAENAENAEIKQENWREKRTAGSRLFFAPSAGNHQLKIWIHRGERRERRDKTGKLERNTQPISLLSLPPLRGIIN